MLQGVLPVLHTGLLDQQAAVDDMQSQVAAVPDIQPYLASLDELAVTFAALPQPPSQLAAQAQAALDGIMQTVQQVRRAEGCCLTGSKLLLSFRQQPMAGAQARCARCAYSACCRCWRMHRAR